MTWEASFKTGKYFSMYSLGKPVFLTKHCGRRPIPTIMPFIFVIRTGRRFMDGPKNYWPFAK